MADIDSDYEDPVDHPDIESLTNSSTDSNASENEPAFCGICDHGGEQHQNTICAEEGCEECITFCSACDEENENICARCPMHPRISIFIVLDVEENE